LKLIDSLPRLTRFLPAWRRARIARILCKLEAAIGELGAELNRIDPKTGRERPERKTKGLH
jgi:hypothetical protein